jgi:hypothetical protein
LLNDADQHIEQKFALLCRERVKHTLIGGCIPVSKLIENLFALRREAQNPGAAVGIVHAPLDEPSVAKLLDKQTHVGAFDAKPGGKAVLVYSGLAVSLVEIGQNGELQWG